MSRSRKARWARRSFESNRSTLGVSMPTSFTPCACSPATNSGLRAAKSSLNCSGSALRQAESQESRLLILDLQGVTYFGSAGLNVVLDCHKQGMQTGTAVRLVADNGLVVRPIEVTNLDSLLDLYPTLPDALEGRDSEQGS